MKAQIILGLKILTVALFAGAAVLGMAQISSAEYYLGLCTPHATQQCYQNNLYWYDSCGNQQELIQYGNCGNSGNYNYGSYLNCYNSDVYWFNSQGQPQNLYQDCGTNYCGSFGAYYCSGAGIFHSRTCYIKGCSFNSCQNASYTDVQLVQICGTNQTCKSGGCVQVQPVQPIYPVQPSYTKHYKKQCSNNNLYWYDSNGIIQDLYENCAGDNSCTQNLCQNNQCTSNLKCDGSTCPTNSEDYTKYCAGGNNQNQNQNQQPNQNNASALSVSILAAKGQNQLSWQKIVSAVPNDKIYFLVIVKNGSIAAIADTVLKVNLPSEISDVQDLKTDNANASGDLVSGVSLGIISPYSSRTITFSAKVGDQNVQGQRQVVAQASSENLSNSDFVAVDMGTVLGVSANTTAQTKSGSPFTDFLKRWYVWILVAVVLIFIFVVVFRRLSSD